MEIALGFLGFVIGCALVFAVCGMVILIVLTYLLDFMKKSSEAFQRLRYVRALKDILPIVLLGFFGGICAGAAFTLIITISIASRFHIPIVTIFSFSIPSMFKFSIPTLIGALIGSLAASVVGIYRASQKWNSCYLCEDRFARYKSIANKYPFEACKLCDYEVLVGKL